MRSNDVRTDHLVTTTLPGPSGDPVQRTYRADETTLVEGLGGITSVEEITPRSNGSIVVVTFRREGQDAIAENLRFTGDDDILVTQGTVVEVSDGETLVLDAEGERQQMDLDFGRGATIDSDRGILASDDLSAGDEVTVYYSDRVDPTLVESDLDGHARLIVRTDR
ncbi:MAG: hypothetical protein AB7T31_15100 [Gemmatimonadales bacterium]